jgi:hypothetical protein
MKRTQAVRRWFWLSSTEVATALLFVTPPQMPEHKVARMVARIGRFVCASPRPNGLPGRCERTALCGVLRSPTHNDLSAP